MPSQSTFDDFSTRKRIYVACVHCRRRKVRVSRIPFSSISTLIPVGQCITTDDSTPCNRCVEKGLSCQYLAVCEEREQSLFTSPGEGSLPSPPPSSTPPPPTWNQASHGGHNRPSSTSHGHNNYPGQSPSQFNPQYTPPSASQFNPSPGYPPSYTAPGSVPYSNRPPSQPHYSNRPPSQPQFPTSPPYMYPMATQSSHYPGSGAPHPAPPAAGFQRDYSSSNSYYNHPGSQAQSG
jgi:hypothetical protein